MSDYPNLRALAEDCSEPSDHSPDPYLACPVLARALAALDALRAEQMREVHKGNMGAKTAVTGETIAAYRQDAERRLAALDREAGDE